MKINRKNLYSERISQGLCGLCGGTKLSDSTAVCETCAEKQRKRYKANRSNGGCYICGEPAHKPGAAYCLKHYNMRMKRRDNRRKMGLCYECGQHEGLSRGKRCEVCFFRNIARRLNSDVTGAQLGELFHLQQKKCPLSGRLLLPGTNCHLDHIIPSSKGGSDDLINLRWVDRNVNQAKCDLNDDDFLRLVADIYNHAKKKDVNQ
jgi:hypothetical protein